MTDAFWIALPGTIAAFSGLIVSLKNGRKADTNRQKLEQIHSDTNGTLSKLSRKLDESRAENVVLTEAAAVAAEK